ncbi:hypothetical protein CCACVL1_09188 [Corchorus capsularis]|uniref:Uncharacterized protein n=1 Tax=Corchorus capsularis TaxID=210143 RepID=A0A1R3IXD9_COCAP|nr:hypothetical protein CCACVL1_09188 [Corchorus capsularis]
MEIPAYLQKVATLKALSRKEVHYGAHATSEQAGGVV